MDKLNGVRRELDEVSKERDNMKIDLSTMEQARDDALQLLATQKVSLIETESRMSGIARDHSEMETRFVATEKSLKKTTNQLNEMSRKFEETAADLKSAANELTESRIQVENLTEAKDKMMKKAGEYEEILTDLRVRFVFVSNFFVSPNE